MTYSEKYISSTYNHILPLKGHKRQFKLETKIMNQKLKLNKSESKFGPEY